MTGPKRTWATPRPWVLAATFVLVLAAAPTGNAQKPTHPTVTATNAQLIPKAGCTEPDLRIQMENGKVTFPGASSGKIKVIRGKSFTVSNETGMDIDLVWPSTATGVLADDLRFRIPADQCLQVMINANARKNKDHKLNVTKPGESDTMGGIVITPQEPPP